MVDWLIEFLLGKDATVTAPEKLRVIIVICTIVTTFLVVGLNQWANASRQRRALKIEKLEALHESASQLEVIIWDSVNAMEKMKELTKLRIFNENQSIHSVENLVSKTSNDSRLTKIRASIDDTHKEISANFLALRSSYQRVTMLCDLHFSGIKINKCLLRESNKSIYIFKSFSSDIFDRVDLTDVSKSLESVALYVKEECVLEMSRYRYLDRLWLKVRRR